MRVLIVEDNPRVIRFLRQGLEEDGYTVSHAVDGVAGLEELLHGDADLCVLDVMLPELSGFEVLERARGAGCDVPILLLTARGAVEDRVRGLDLGADDYLAKPFAFEELLARLRVLQRRLRRGEAEVLTYADVTMDLRTRKAQRAGRHLHLSPREFSLLQLFLQNAGQALTRAQILRDAFDVEFDPSTNIVDVYVAYLRRKLRTPALIKTVRGTGYQLTESSS